MDFPYKADTHMVLGDKAGICIKYPMVLLNISKLFLNFTFILSVNISIYFNNDEPGFYKKVKPVQE
jgi:hypothetical protein